MEILALFFLFLSFNEPVEHTQSDLEFMIGCYMEEIDERCRGADLNKDLVVNIKDYVIFWSSEHDLNGDGVVDFHIVDEE